VGSCIRDVLEVPEVMRCVLFCMLEAVESGLRLLDVMLCVLEVVEGRLCLREMSEVLEVLEAMRCVQRCQYAGGCGGWAQFSSRQPPPPFGAWLGYGLAGIGKTSFDGEMPLRTAIAEFAQERYSAGTLSTTSHVSTLSNL